MEPELLSHGSLCHEQEWGPPKLIAESKELSRPGYTKITASEYVDKDDVLKEKVKILAKLIKES